MSRLAEDRAPAFLAGTCYRGSRAMDLEETNGETDRHRLGPCSRVAVPRVGAPGSPVFSVRLQSACSGASHLASRSPSARAAGRIGLLLRQRDASWALSKAWKDGFRLRMRVAAREEEIAALLPKVALTIPWTQHGQPTWDVGPPAMACKQVRNAGGPEEKATLERRPPAQWRPPTAPQDHRSLWTGISSPPKPRPLSLPRDSALLPVRGCTGPLSTAPPLSGRALLLGKCAQVARGLGPPLGVLGMPRGLPGSEGARGPPCPSSRWTEEEAGSEPAPSCLGDCKDDLRGPEGCQRTQRCPSWCFSGRRLRRSSPDPGGNRTALGTSLCLPVTPTLAGSDMELKAGRGRARDESGIPWPTRRRSCLALWTAPEDFGGKKRSGAQSDGHPSSQWPCPAPSSPWQPRTGSNPALRLSVPCLDSSEQCCP
ncbi:uncharacterized protein LOC107649921 [Monodelphis domestica]|uniref:uncharacterized protein LOC107649921 n=1 Tax=Monodelphis domestica TaxID=13616 RepID=UPI0024E225DF|nr:uncharacterized protein LOC107649921 [Monodelphis domestica]